MSEEKTFNQVDMAYRIAKSAHAGQLDKGGNDYIDHPIAVANMLFTDEEKIVGLLHDVVEDTFMTMEELEMFGFSKRVLDAVDCLTKRDGEPLYTYLERVKRNSLATVVKMADLTHNSDMSRIEHPVEEDILRNQRYKTEIEFLKNSLM